MQRMISRPTRGKRGDSVSAKRDFFPGVLILLGCMLSAPQTGATDCLHCHQNMQQGFSPAHSALASDCTRCHAGDPEAASTTAAHDGLIAFPGNLDNAKQACGNCHSDKVDGVMHSLMHTGAGMIATTREVFGEPIDIPGHNDLANLTDSPADSLLRKFCASCHLGQNKTVHQLDATHDRGGGCLACHINEQPAPAHPALTAQVSDARCFGCHSRSSRISLNFAGLAETDSTSADTSRLEDGRGVEFRPADRHHAAGMACIDCHTARDLMGIASGHAPAKREQAADIRCMDCHAVSRTIGPGQWPRQFAALLSRVPYPVTDDTRIPVTENGTPLWNVEIVGEAAWLHRKLAGERLPIPPYRANEHPLAQAHSRLSCSACHSQWAPQCYSCHLGNTAGEKQYDHIAGFETAGRWDGQRSDVRNDLPPLGVNADNTVVPVVPGMIMTVAHPDWSDARFTRRFAEIAPHTTGPARSCASCHRSPTALGLGQGQLVFSNQQWTFKPGMKILADGLAADAWTTLDGMKKSGEAKVLRPFSSAEIARILAVPVPPDEENNGSR